MMHCTQRRSSHAPCASPVYASCRPQRSDATTDEVPYPAQSVFVDAAAAAQEALQDPEGAGDDGGGSRRREMRSLQRMAAAAADPLVKLGRSAAGVVARRLGSTSALALTGGIGVLRIGVGTLRGPAPAHCQPILVQLTPWQTYALSWNSECLLLMPECCRPPAAFKTRACAPILQQQDRVVKPR